jgi:hypothetical protein
VSSSIIRTIANQLAGPESDSFPLSLFAYNRFGDIANLHDVIE